jgi:hypothetical protein
MTVAGRDTDPLEGGGLASIYRDAAIRRCLIVEVAVSLKQCLHVCIIAHPALGSIEEFA